MQSRANGGDRQERRLSVRRQSLGDDAQQQALSSLEAAIVNSQRPLPSDFLVSVTTLGHEPLVRMALDAGTNPDARDAGGRSALEMAIRTRRADLCELLLSRGADARALLHDGSAPLAAACLLLSNSAADGPAHRCFQALLAHGADAAAQGTDGTAAVHAAALRGHAGALRELLRRGAPAEARDGHGWTALKIAARRLHADCLRRAGPAPRRASLLSSAGRRGAQGAD
eukprot:tig00001056_g6632.t1